MDRAHLSTDPIAPRCAFRHAYAIFGPPSLDRVTSYALKLASELTRLPARITHFSELENRWHTVDDLEDPVLATQLWVWVKVTYGDSVAGPFPATSYRDWMGDEDTIRFALLPLEDTTDG